MAAEENIQLSSTNLQTIINDIIYHYINKAEENERILYNFKANLKIDSQQNASLARKNRQLTTENAELRLELKNSENLVEGMENKLYKLDNELSVLRKRQAESKIVKILERENEHLSERLKEMEALLDEEKDNREKIREDLLNKETENTRLHQQNQKVLSQLEELTYRHEQEKTILMDQVDLETEEKIVEMRYNETLLKNKVNALEKEKRQLINEIAFLTNQHIRAARRTKGAIKWQV